MKQTLKLSFLSLFFVSLFSCGSIQKKKEVEILKPASLSFVELAPFFPKDTFAVGRIRIDKFAHDWFPHSRKKQAMLK